MPKAKGATARPTWLVPVAVLVISALVLVIVLGTGGESNPSADQAADTSAAVGEDSEVEVDEREFARELERRDPDDPLTDGPVDAPIVMVVYSDYQCPFCAGWSHETLPVMREYAETGDLRIEWRDLNIITPEASERAAIATYAAGLQGDFWEYHEALYPEGETLPESELSEDGLIDIAVELGLDEDRFVEDMSSDETRAEITRNAQEGLMAGAASTPAFIIDGQPVVGAQPTGVFVELIEDALADGR